MLNIIRHGYETPLTTDLEKYQLGWSVDDKCLYIRNENEVVSVISPEFVEKIVESFMDTDTFKNKIKEIVSEQK